MELKMNPGNVRDGGGVLLPKTSAWGLAAIIAAGWIFSGCLFKSNTVEPRRFVLTPAPVSARTAPMRHEIAISISPVQMPEYLSRRSLLVRKSASEIDYLEDAVWAEPLDEGVRRVLAANLALLLPSSQVDVRGDEHSQVRVTVSLEQLDVNEQGRGVLVARWRLAAPGAAQPLKTGETRFSNAGAAPAQSPEAIPATLSALVGELSGQLAEAIRQSATQL